VSRSCFQRTLGEQVLLPKSSQEADGNLLSQSSLEADGYLLSESSWKVEDAEAEAPWFLVWWFGQAKRCGSGSDMSRRDAGGGWQNGSVSAGSAR
jgi:hypothetical protein